MEVVAFIPVRGGSKSIPRKNIKNLAGRPLVHWTALAALDCPEIDKVFVASEDEEIRQVAARIEHERFEVINRDPSTATDQATSESALLEFANAHQFDKVVFIQATSPLLKGSDISGALQVMKGQGADSLLSVTREFRFRWNQLKDGSVQANNYDPLKRPRRQDWNGELVENGAFYISSRKALLDTQCRISGKIAAWEMSPETAIELDEPLDWQMTEQLLSKPQSDDELINRCKKIKLLVTDVDGVLTDSGMYYGPDGEALKKFNTRDAMGLAIWRKAGFDVAIMTSEDTKIVSSRAAKLNIDKLFMGVKNKATTLNALIKKEGLSPEQVAFIGDDINDLPALSIVGLASSPRNATEANKALAHYICQNKGGKGCVRELVEFILKNKAR